MPHIFAKTTADTRFTSFGLGLGLKTILSRKQYLRQTKWFLTHWNWTWKEKRRLSV